MVGQVIDCMYVDVWQVLETSWITLQKELLEAQDLDGMIAAHDAYLRRITDKSFLSNDKYQLHTALQAVRTIDISIHVLSTYLPTYLPTYPPQVLNMILEFCNLHYNLCVDAMKEHKGR